MYKVVVLKSEREAETFDEYDAACNAAQDDSMADDEVHAVLDAFEQEAALAYGGWLYTL